MPIISGGGGGGGLGAVVLSGAAAANQVPTASGSSAATWKYPPGFEIGRATITAAANATDTSEATATALITAGPFTFDGGAVVAEVYAPYFQSPSPLGNSITVTLFEGATEIARLGIIASVVAGVTALAPLRASHIFTPSAAAHTYKVCAFVTSTTGTPQIGAGAGGTGAYAPAYLRFVKV